ncbi:hypothetical protein B0H16DRAFT_575483 [Mycena metata]|uniref:Uncharacterized protein n=1 Tax=Mycena metata TaxID=1033252 RepID=A0AAD7JA55_9AGAR|nr:hypothetical protein B0H16DRAFT_575483 [Mycena metata]
MPASLRSLPAFKLSASSQELVFEFGLRPKADQSFTLYFVFSLSFVYSCSAVAPLRRGTKLKCDRGVSVPRYLPITRSMQLPFRLSYIVFTPRHVRLPGEEAQLIQDQFRDKATSTPSRWPRLVAGTKSLRSFKSIRRLRGSASTPPEDCRPGDHETE